MGEAEGCEKVTDTTIITDPIAYGRERDIDLSAARRGYLNGIETAIRILRRHDLSADSWQAQGIIDSVVYELAAILKGKEVVL